MAMFQQPVRPAGNVICEFKAGMCDWDRRTVKPDKRKGKIVLMTSEDEGLMHLQWHDREKNEVVKDLIVVNDAYLQKVEKVKDGRVYLLRFTSSDKKMFFWMQDPKEEKDAEFVLKFNEAIGATIPSGDGSSATAAGGAAAAAAALGLNTNPNQPIDPQLQLILNQFLANQGAAGATRAQPIPLNSVLTTEVLTGLCEDSTASAEMATLMPEGQRSAEDIRECLASPQIQQSMAALSQAVHSDQIQVLFAGLGLDSSILQTLPPGTDALEALCRAMEAQASNSGAN